VTVRDPDVFGALAHRVIWRGSRREVDIVFGKGLAGVHQYGCAANELNGPVVMGQRLSG